jgi:Fic family protein
MIEKPPYTITEKAADYLAKIVETVTRLEFGTEFKRDIKLHRENRARTIHSSLAIEGNSLTLGEVTAVIEGRVVAGKQAEIKEVKNAYEAYDKIMTFDPYAIGDFLKAHRLMTDGLVTESGRFRGGDVGVFDGGMAVHIGARPQFVPKLMDGLFGWAKKSELHPVLKSAILHYEIETIHPFADGNGRMGRLWQTLLLAKWNAIFAWIPMESVLYQNRPQYYQAIRDARKANDSGVFIEFTLSALSDIISAQEKRQAESSDAHPAMLKPQISKNLADKLPIKVADKLTSTETEFVKLQGIEKGLKTMTLNNKLKIGDSAELARVEEKISKKNAKELFESGHLDELKAGKYSTLAEIHRVLFDEIYNFAGKTRDTNLAKGNFRFAPVMYLKSALDHIDAMPQSTFDEIIEKYVEMNIAHPFREGNGRSARIWLDLILKKELFQVVDWSKVDKNDYLLAMERSPIKDVEIKQLLRSALTGKINDREIYMKGIDTSYYYEGYTVFKADEL